MREDKPIILAIDDTLANLLTLGAALAGEFDLRISTAGAHGLELAASVLPELILLDVMMPEMDGFEVCRRLKADPRLQQIPVIFITALIDSDSESKGLALGAADFLSKPLHVGIARQRIRNLVDRESLRRQVEQQRDQLALQVETLLNLTTAVEQSPASVVITDLDACIQYVNPRFSEVTGYSSEEALGQNPRILQSGKTGKAVYEKFWGQLSGGEPWRGELLNKRKSGELYWEEAQIAPVKNAAGDITHYVAVKTDITQRKLVEAELERHRQHLEAMVEARTLDLSIAKEAAEMANRAKTTFLANMSHELRTPLSGIIGLTGLALRRVTEAPLQDLLRKVEKSSQQLLAIINDILDISRIEAKRLTLEQVDFQLGGVLENIQSLMAPKAAEKGLEFLVDRNPAIARLSVCGDPLRLGQILLNLVGNAVKFTAQGRVVVSAEMIADCADTVSIRFQVTDTGIGIAEADCQRIFLAFEQADGSMSRKYGGTGLGLAISKHLAKLMGGDIGVESVPGAGSCFSFTVSLGKVAAVAVAAEAPGQRWAEAKIKARYAGRRVLLVEDEPINQEVSRGILAEAGLQVDLATNGYEAVEMAQAVDYSLILMDMQMPLMGGIEATQRIRQMAERRRTPIIAMTANAFEEDRQHCLMAGMNDFIAKPVDSEMLFGCMLRWLAQHAA